MVCLDEAVRSLLIDDAELTALVAPKNIVQIGEPVSLVYPRIGFEEISNVPAGFADNIETATSVTYRFLIYAQRGKMVNEIMQMIETDTIVYGFTRHSSARLYNLPDGVHGKELIMKIQVKARK